MLDDYERVRENFLNPAHVGEAMAPNLSDVQLRLSVARS